MRLTPQQLKEARDWIKDCTWGDIFCDEDVDEMSDDEIEAGIIRHYGGGLEEFVRCCVDDCDMKPRDKEIQISLTYEEIHWLEYLILASMEDFRDYPEKKQLYLQILNKFSASKSEDINLSPNQN